MAKNDNQTPETAKTKKAGFDEDGQAYPGVNPDTGERVTVTFEGLKKEFGAKRGENMYGRIFETLFTNPRPTSSGAEYNPDLQLAGVPKETRDQVDTILSEKE